MINFRVCDCGCVDTEVHFCDFDGYVVECPHCGAITENYARKEQAVDAWNRHDLYYGGLL